MGDRNSNSKSDGHRKLLSIVQLAHFVCPQLAHFGFVTPFFVLFLGFAQSLLHC